MYWNFSIWSQDARGTFLVTVLQWHFQIMLVILTYRYKCVFLYLGINYYNRIFLNCHFDIQLKLKIFDFPVAVLYCISTRKNLPEAYASICKFEEFFTWSSGIALVLLIIVMLNVFLLIHWVLNLCNVTFLHTVKNHVQVIIISNIIFQVDALGFRLMHMALRSERFLIP